MSRLYHLVLKLVTYRWQVLQPPLLPPIDMSTADHLQQRFVARNARMFRSLSIDAQTIRHQDCPRFDLIESPRISGGGGLPYNQSTLNACLLNMGGSLLPAVPAQSVPVTGDRRYNRQKRTASEDNFLSKKRTKSVTVTKTRANSINSAATTAPNVKNTNYFTTGIISDAIKPVANRITVKYPSVNLSKNKDVNVAKRTRPSNTTIGRNTSRYNTGSSQSDSANTTIHRNLSRNNTGSSQSEDDHHATVDSLDPRLSQFSSLHSLTTIATRKANSSSSLPKTTTQSSTSADAIIDSGV